ncbi:MAG: hypothetical protein PUF62_04560 [Bacteroidales bacterium]|nr:hypothetical protein [Bacteroidales bacterium]
MKQRILFLFMIVSLLFAGSGRLWAYGETTSYVLDESSEFSIGAYSNSSGVEFTLSGPGATLSFSIKKKSAATQTTYVYGYDSSGNETTLGSYSSGSLTTSYVDKSIEISESIVKIKFKASGTLNKYISNVKVTRATTLSTSTSSIDFGSRDISAAAITKTASITYNNTTYNQQVIGTCTDSHFTVTSKDVGYTGTTTVNISYTSSTPGSHSGTVTLTMNGKTVTFGVSATSTTTYRFAATATPNDASYGSANATVAAAVISNSTKTSESTTATFTATPNTGYRFLGWGTSADASTYVSTANPYQMSLNNSVPQSTVSQTLYAIFEEIPPKILKPSDISDYEEAEFQIVILNRNFSAGFNTIALPFATTRTELGVDGVYELCNVGYDTTKGYTFYFKEVEELKANKPYVIKHAAPINTISWTVKTLLSLTPGSTTCGAWTMTANFTPGMSMSGKYGVVNGRGKVMKGGASSTLNAYSAYFVMNPTTRADAYTHPIPADAVPLFSIPVGR